MVEQTGHEGSTTTTQTSPVRFRELAGGERPDILRDAPCRHRRFRGPQIMAQRPHYQ